MNLSLINVARPGYPLHHAVETLSAGLLNVTSVSDLVTSAVELITTLFDHTSFGSVGPQFTRLLEFLKSLQTVSTILSILTHKKKVVFTLVTFTVFTFLFKVMTAVPYRAFVLPVGQRPVVPSSLPPRNVPGGAGAQIQIMPVSPGFTIPTFVDPEMFNESSYPPICQNEVRATIQRIFRNEQDLQNLMTLYCKECKQIYQNCTCANGPQTKAAELFTNARQGRDELRSLRYGGEINTSLPVGSSFCIPHKGNLVTRLVSKVFHLDQILTVSRSFEVQDLRPNSDKHIAVSNTRFVVIQISDLVLRFSWNGAQHNYTLPTFLSRVNGLGFRDLVVSEELMRNRRKAIFNKEPSEVITMQIENSLSVPCQDPCFLTNGINPLRDSAFFLKCLVTNVISPNSPF
jgi:hypothetical protein